VFAPFTAQPEGPLARPFYGWVTGDLNLTKAALAALLAQVEFRNAAKAASYLVRIA